jgi:3-hydroxybutyryl-CoA dehydrogenase
MVEMSSEDEAVHAIGLLGLGTMGRGIAKACLANGVDVMFYEVDRPTAERNLAKLKDDLKRKVDKGKLTKEAMDEMLGRIRVIDDLSELSKVRFVIEAIFEDARLKEALYKRLDAAVSAETIVCSNTSSLGISDLSLNLRDPSRFAGMHFFNPADVMKLVEVARGKNSSEKTISAISAFATQLGKTPIIVPDIPGFYVNRILFPMIIEGVRVKEQTGSPSKDIDESMKLGAGLPMGPLELSDMIGVDVVLHICEMLHKRMNDPRFDPPALLKKMVEEGKLGRKAKAGFYDYS